MIIGIGMGLLAALFVGLSVADLLTTRRALTRYAGRVREGNPLARRVLERFGVRGLVAVKLVVLAAVAALTWWWGSSWVLAGACAGTAVAVVNNVRVLRKLERSR